MRIAVDAMGGDFAPREIVRGAVEASRAWPELEIVLLGDVLGPWQVLALPDVVLVDVDHVVRVVRVPDDFVQRESDFIRLRAPGFTPDPEGRNRAAGPRASGKGGSVR